MSFTFIDVDKPKKLVTSPFYKQHVCAYVTVFTLDDPITVK